MCGRFALTLPRTAVRAHFKAEDWPALPGLDATAAAIDHPRYNIRPTEDVLVVALAPDADGRGDAARRLRPMRWGFLPHWQKTLTASAPLINARSETIAEKPAFKRACRERRCLIPADGFYEWRGADGSAGLSPANKSAVETRAAKASARTPYWIAPAAGGPLAFAGVWQEWRGIDAKGASVACASVAIVTCAANSRMRALHERLPVAIPPEAYGLWLGEEGHGAAALMRAPAEDFYAFHPVSERINRGGRQAPDDPELTRPVDPAPPSEEAAGRLI